MRNQYNKDSKKTVKGKGKKAYAAIEDVRNILNALPSVVLLLNNERQIVYCNRNYYESFGNRSIQEILGLNPGELLGCTNIQEGSKCGTSESCRVCGLYNAILDSQNESTEIIRNSKITIKNKKGVYIDITFRITASPFCLNSGNSTLVTISDISKEKRIKSLERIFLHDLYDKVSSLSFLLESVVDKTPQSQNAMKLKHSKFLSSEIVEEIESYRALLAAEKGDLEIADEWVNSYDIIWNSVNNISYHTVAHGKSIEVLENTDRSDFKSDPIILGRILMNMLKNALEATDRGGTIRASCERKEGNILFWVQNQKEMTEQAQKHIFERQFSTKGSHRGLGTYSIRLLGEEYLGGEVYFNSQKEQGTIFYFSIPASTRKT